MRYALVFLLLAGCKLDRYSMSPGADGAMWRLNTTTGEIWRCTSHANRVDCAQSSQP